MEKNKVKAKDIFLNPLEGEDEVDFVSDSLTAYLRQLEESQPLSAEEEFALMKEYNDYIEGIWDELCSFGFVANEYLNILEDISPGNISENFSILSILKEKNLRLENLLPDFQKWKTKIEKIYSEAINAFSKADKNHTTLMKNLKEILKTYRPQNHVIEEWLEVALQYKKGLEEDSVKNLDSKKSEDYIISRIMIPKQRFLQIIEKIEDMRRKADELRTKILEANLRLVFSVAKKYQNKGLSLNDLIQEGNIGLMKALDKFDYRLGNKFSTYASWWLKQHIGRAIAEQTRTIRIPMHMIATLTRMRVEEENFIQEYGREPSPEELAKLLDMPKERIRALQKMASQTVSLQAPVHKENHELSFADILEDEKSEDPVQKAAYSVLKERLKEVLDMLTERERQILVSRFGLDNEKEKTLEELSQKFGITRERVRQIEAKALQKLRHPSRRKYLEGYF